MELKYEGVFQDGTGYEISLHFKDPRLYSAVARVLGAKGSERTALKGLIALLSDLAKESGTIGSDDDYGLGDDE